MDNYIKLVESSNNATEAITLIEEHCKDFLKHKKVLYRAVSSDVEDFGRFKVKKNRTPRNSTLDQQQFTDKYLKSINAPLRSESIFASKLYSDAYEFGPNILIIFPIGKCKTFYFDEIDDLTYFFMDVNESINELIKDLSDVGKKELIKKITPDHFKELNKFYKQNNSIKKAIDAYIDMLGSFVYSEDDRDTVANIKDTLFNKLKLFEFYHIDDLKQLKTQEVNIDCEEYFYINEESDIKDIVLGELGLA